MSVHGQTATALLTEHFRYTPLTLLDEIINTVNELVYHAVNQLEKAFLNAPTDVLGFGEDGAVSVEELRRTEVETGIMQIESLLNATVDKDFDIVEIYALRNILALGHDEDADLAQWVTLDHYRDIKFDATQTMAVTPEAVQLQRRKLYETAKLNIMLQEEQARNKAILAKLDSFVQSSDAPLSFLLAQDMTTDSVSAGMASIVSRLPQIRQYLAQLSSTLIAPTQSRRIVSNAAELQRRTYLNTQTIDALKRRNIAPDEQVRAAASREPQQQGAITPETVRGLEAIARGLGVADERLPEGG